MGIFEAQTGDGTDLAPPRTPNAGPVVTSNLVSGFIRPEFVLGLDFTHLDIPGDGWGLERLGEDVILSDMLGFDIQVYDPQARYVDTSLFATGATNVIVGPSEAGYRDAFAEAIVQAAANSTTVDTYTELGGYVDLCYPVLAGGSIRGWASNRSDRLATANNTAILTTGLGLATPFSGIINYPATATSLTAYQPSLGQSGRYITTGTSIRAFQPVFDTFTNYYETDGLTQSPVNTTSLGVRTRYTPSVNPDVGSDGIDSNGLYGVDDATERETSPPFTTKPESLRVSIRVENSAVRALRQQTVVLRD